MRSKSVLFPLLFATACLTGDDVLDEDELGAADQEITNGTFNSNPYSVGMVQLVWPGGGMFCSGTLIAPDWILTAGHCNPNVGVDHARMGNADDPSAQTSIIDRFVGNPAMDLGLAHLSKSFDVPGAGLNFRRSLFSDPTGTLLSKNTKFYGSSIDSSCTGPSCNYGYLRTANVFVNLFAAHNLGGSSSATSVGGDSGGGLLYETSAGKELTGVLKCGLRDCLVRPEAFRKWALGYLYDLPFELPQIWNYGTNSGHFFAEPLQDSYTASTTFDVCPGGRPYTYSLSYQLEQGYDWVRVRSNQPERSFTGTSSATGTGQGLLTLSIQTDISNRSVGLKSFSVQCQNGIQFPNPWGVPSPAGTNDVRSWDPCPGGETWRWTAEHAYAPGANGMVGFTVLDGNSTTSGTARGPVNVASYTPGGGTDGMRRLTATCDLAIPCHGNTCFTKAQPTTAMARVASTTWNPCNGGGFRYRASYVFGLGDQLRVTGGTTNENFTVGYGAATTAWRSAGGTVNVQVGMSTSGTTGVKELVAQCDAWGADRTTQVQVQRATYGRNCRVNPDNVTQKVLASCKAQGGSSCNYSVSTSALGDPAVGCAKDFSVDYTCGTSSAPKRAYVAGEANGQVARMICP